MRTVDGYGERLRAGEGLRSFLRAQSTPSAARPVPPPTSPEGPTGSHEPTAPRPRRGGWIAVVVTVLVVAAATFAVYYVYYRPSTSSSSPGLTAGGFALGQVVTFRYNGTRTFSCTPALTVLFPNDPNAAGASSSTPCGVGNASVTAVPSQVPQWYLLPAFSGLSAFGLTNYNATSSGFPTQNGSTVYTDCGAGATSSKCPDQPSYAFSPLFAQFETRIGQPTGLLGQGPGVLPFPAHDMVENFTSYPLVPWGTVVVFVMDPNILPNRSTGACTETAPSNLSHPTGNCLTSYSAIASAASTCSNAAESVNSATGNPIWWVLTHEDHLSACAQVYIPAPGTLAPSGPGAGLDSNLYEPYAVSAGAPSSFPG